MSRSRKREAKTAIQEDAASIREDLRHVDQEPALAVAASQATLVGAARHRRRRHAPGDTLRRREDYRSALA
jgi:hypothetical protein